MFEEDAIKSFFGKSSQGVDIPDVNTNLDDFEYVDEASSGRVETDHVYEHRDELDTEHFVSKVDTSDLKGTLHDKVNAMLTRLENHLRDGAKLLEENEIKAALDTATY